MNFDINALRHHQLVEDGQLRVLHSPASPRQPARRRSRFGRTPSARKNGI